MASNQAGHISRYNTVFKEMVLPRDAMGSITTGTTTRRTAADAEGDFARLRETILQANFKEWPNEAGVGHLTIRKGLFNSI